jgi:LysM repeat protein
MTRTLLPLKRRLLSGAFLPVVGMGVALAFAGLPDGVAQSQNPCAAKKPAAGRAACNPCNPCAAAANPCNPCAAAGAAGDRTYTIRAGDSLADVAQQTYGDPGLYRMLADYNGIADPDRIVVGQVIRLPANPCAAANPCNPCSPCNPCAAQATAGASDCVVPRLQSAAVQNPCAAVNPCNPCAANPCNPCAANPCAAANPCNPCNPCAAANPCNPCVPGEVVELTPAEATAAYECVKGVMKAAYAGEMPQAAGGPCNPCNPCAAVKPANPCNPCAAVKPVNPCNPGAVQSAALTGEAATIAQEYQSWERVNTAPYVSATHGSRYVNNYPGPEAAEAYGRFEEVGAMPAGGRIAKDSFTVSPDGRVGVGPLFVMEKMAEGFNDASADWRYAMIMPDGSLFGVTNGPGSQNVAFCAECHAIVADDQDSLYFLPEEFRVTSR